MKSVKRAVISLPSLLAYLAFFGAYRPQTGSAADDVPPPGAADRLKAAFAALEAGYASTNAAGRAVNTSYDADGGTFFRAETKFEYSKITNMLKFTKYDATTERPPGPRRPVGSVAYCYNTSLFFRLEKRPGSDSFFVKDLKKVSGPDASFARGQLSDCCDCPYSAGLVRLSTLLSRSDFALVGMRQVVLDGAKLMRLQFRMKPKEEAAAKAKKEGRLWSVSVLVDPERRYVVRGFTTALSVRNSSAVRLTSGTVEYDGDHAGLPIPRRFTSDEIAESSGGQTIRLGGGDEVVGRRKNTAIYTFETFDFNPKPPSDFELTAFGLPDLTKPNPSAHRGFDARWFFVLAALALVLSVAFKVYASRRRRGPLPGELSAG